MLRRAFYSLIVVGLACANAVGVSIQLAGGNATSPFEVDFGDLGTPPTITLQLAADAQEGTVTILGYQLMNLELRPTDSAQGTLQFLDAGTPPNSLFGDDPGPLFDPLPPTSTISALDADTSPDFSGVPLVPSSPHNIVLFTLSASAEAVGAFRLIMPETVNPDGDSSWFDADENTGGSKAFTNSAPSEFEGFVLLGTINIGGSTDYKLGDYNRDGEVDSLDYDCWLADFGSDVSVPGAGADGNQDSIVDTADYVVWRKASASQSEAAGLSTLAIPEPDGLALCALALGIVSQLRNINPKGPGREASAI